MLLPFPVSWEKWRCFIQLNISSSLWSHILNLEFCVIPLSLLRGRWELSQLSRGPGFSSIMITVMTTCIVRGHNADSHLNLRVSGRTLCAQQSLSCFITEQSVTVCSYFQCKPSQCCCWWRMHPTWQCWFNPLIIIVSWDCADTRGKQILWLLGFN